MARKAVTISTDGQRDFVTTPDGVKHILGTVSVLQVVSKLAPPGHARRVLDEFNTTGEVMVTLDLDRLFEMLAPKRRRLLASPLISGSDRTTKGTTMAADADKGLQDAIKNQIGTIERQIEVLNQKAKETSGQPAADMKVEVGRLQDLIAWLKRPSPYGDQSDNSDAYGLKGVTPGGVKTASYETFAENMALAETVLGQVAETTEIVDKLASAGRRFNASKAQSDLHEITSKVAALLQDVDLAQPWVKRDLNSLAERAAHIHGLFAQAK